MSTEGALAASELDSMPEFVFHPQSQKDVEAIFRFEEYPLDRVIFSHVDCVVDIGAHCGTFSYLCADRYPEAHIRAFEPLQINYALAEANTRPFVNVDMRRYGLSDYDGETNVFYSLAFGYAASSSVKTHDHSDDFEKVLIRRAAIELSDLPDITILKIDTEGHEYRILTDLADRISEISTIFMEIHSNQDRKRIDAMLGNEFVLFYSRCKFINRYKVAYVNKQHLKSYHVKMLVAPALQP